MNEIADHLRAVWTPSAVIAALASGLVIGFGLSWPIANPLWSSRFTTPRQVALLVTAMTSWIVTVLYVASILVAAVQGGFRFPMVVATYSLFLFAALCSGLGAWLALRIRGTW